MRKSDCDDIVNAYAKGVLCGREYVIRCSKSQKSQNGENETFPTFSRCFDEKREIKFGVWSSDDRMWYEKILPKMYDDALGILKSLSLIHI